MERKVGCIFCNYVSHDIYIAFMKAVRYNRFQKTASPGYDKTKAKQILENYRGIAANQKDAKYCTFIEFVLMV